MPWYATGFAEDCGKIYRLNEAQFQPGWDIVVVARTKAVHAGFGELTESYLSLARKAGILRAPES